jgi:hypothetical protein
MTAHRDMTKRSRTLLIIIVAVPLFFAFLALLWYPTYRKTPPAGEPVGPGSVDSDMSEVGEVSVGLVRVLSKQIDKLDPNSDGWDTENLGALAKKRLKKLGKILESSGDINSETVAEFVLPSFQCGALRPQGLKQVFGDGSLRVLRPGDGSSSDSTTAKYNAATVSDAFRGLMAGHDSATDRRLHFKVFRVEKLPGADGRLFRTTSFFESVATTSQGSIQQNATWNCDWARNENDPDQVALNRIEVEDYEEVVLTLDSHRLFSDCTEAVIAKDPSYSRQLVYSQMHWTRRLPVRVGIDLISHNGVAVGDANGDGLDDIYAGQTGGLPNLLLIHQKDGTVVDVAKTAGLDFLERTRASLFVDIDNDSDQDLIIAFTGGISVQRNDGNLRFTECFHVGSIEGITSIVAGDFDKDALVDLFVCVYPGRSPFPYEDATNGEPNLLFRNTGNGKFQDVSVERGFLKEHARFSFAAAWEDYDNDGDPDLYISNDYGRNNLYRNDSGRFVDVAASSGVEDIAAGMSVTWGDYNHDGWMDIYISNMFSAAGNRVAYQREFRESASAEANKDVFRRHARGNSLFMNQGDGTFVDTSVSAGVTMGRWSWSSLFADINNDGLEDLLVSNGYLTAEKPDDL